MLTIKIPQATRMFLNLISDEATKSEKKEWYEDTPIIADKKAYSANEFFQMISLFKGKISPGLAEPKEGRSSQGRNQTISNTLSLSYELIDLLKRGDEFSGEISETEEQATNEKKRWQECLASLLIFSAGLESLMVDIFVKEEKEVPTESEPLSDPTIKTTALGKISLVYNKKFEITDFKLIPPYILDKRAEQIVKAITPSVKKAIASGATKIPGVSIRDEHLIKYKKFDMGV